MASAVPDTFTYGVELFGIASFACCGAFQAVRADLSFFGTVLLSVTVGLGGGLFRDLVLGLQPVAFADLGYFCTPLVVAVVVFFAHSAASDRKVLGGSALDTCDAAAVAIASVSGCVKAVDHGANVSAAIALGVITAIGGGVVSNLLVQERPAVLCWGHEMLVTPAVLGAGPAAVLRTSGHLNLASAVACMALVLLIRVLALRRNWHTPRSLLWKAPGQRARRHRVDGSAGTASARTECTDGFAALLPYPVEGARR